MWYKGKEEILKQLETSSKGITNSEANKRLKEEGLNRIPTGKRNTIWNIIIEQLKNPIIFILFFSAIFSIITQSKADAIFIFVVIGINTIIGTYQEWSSEKSAEKLQNMIKIRTKVLRDGKIEEIDSENIVVGDIIELESGNKVPADLRLIDVKNLSIDESVLTGESKPKNKLDITLPKETELAERDNIAFAGSIVTKGRGIGVVIATGQYTEFGKVAENVLLSEDSKTPLVIKIEKFSKQISFAFLIFAIIVSIFLFFKGYKLSEILSTVIALTVSAIPEGLTIAMTIVLSVSSNKMAKRHVIVKKLNAVESLGSCNVIATDKTGTLTQNKMTVVQDESNNPKLLAEAMALCSDAEIGEDDIEAIGEPTEAALVNFANKIGLPKYKLEQEAPRIGEAPFDSMRKMMSTVHNKNEKIIQYTKGACEILLERSTHYLDKDGQVVPMTEEIKQEVRRKNKEFADKALRLLGAAYREHDQVPENFDAENLEKDLTFIGFVGMIDPCRPEVYDAIKECRKAGIRPVMITGDHIDTAVAIGKDLGIIKDASEAMTGAELDGLSEKDLIKKVKKCSVFARVQPEHKTKIVRAFKAQDLVVAMTGDGVNDAPSIKAADIGISMGITGTDVTKQASDMVLADDNFATIVNAVEEGRKIYDNIRKVLQFQLSTNTAEVIYVFLASAFGITVVTPAQLLWINMVTDSTPGLALGMEKAEGNLMKRKPRNSNEGVFSDGAGSSMIIHGVIMASIVLISFFIGQYIELGHYGVFESVDGMTMAFLTANLVEMFYAICMRTQKGSIFKMKTRNKWLLGSFMLSLIFTAGVIYIPALSNLFGLATISFKEFAIAFGLAFLVIPITEIAKYFQRRKTNEES